MKEAFYWLTNQFLKQKRPFVAADAVIKYYQKGRFRGIVLVDRKNAPKGWAFPGGFVNYGETVEQAAKREVKEETGLNVRIEKLLDVLSEPKRDPRLHVISAVFLCKAKGTIKAGSDAKEARIFPLKKIPKLVLGHGEVIKKFRKILQN